MGVRPKSLTEAERQQRVGARAARTEKGNPEQDARLVTMAELLHAADARPPDVDPGFQEATFLGVLKKAAINSGGGWSVLVEVPYADLEAFFPVAKAAEVELVWHVIRKPTARARRAAATA